MHKKNLVCKKSGRVKVLVTSFSKKIFFPPVKRIIEDKMLANLLEAKNVKILWELPSCWVHYLLMGTVAPRGLHTPEILCKIICIYVLVCLHQILKRSQWFPSLIVLRNKISLAQVLTFISFDSHPSKWKVQFL